MNSTTRNSKAAGEKKKPLNPRSAAEKRRVIENGVRNFRQNILEFRCVMRVDMNEALPTTDPAYVGPIYLGDMTDTLDSYVMHNEMSVVVHRADIPEQEDISHPTGLGQQVWFSEMRFNLNHSYMDLEDKKVVYDPEGKWSLRLLAAQQEDGKPSITVTMPRMVKPTGKGIPEQEIEAYINYVGDMSPEGLRMANLRQRGALQYAEIHLRAKNLSKADTFVLMGTSRSEAYYAKYLERLHSPAVQNTKLVFRMFFESLPATRGEADILLTEAFGKFLTAQHLELENPQYVQQIYATHAFEAVKSNEGFFKPIDRLPSWRIRCPLVYANPTELFMMLSLGLHYQVGLARLVNEIVSQFKMQARFILRDDGTFCCFIRLPESLPSNAQLQLGTRGHIRFIGADIPNWSYVVAVAPPGIGMSGGLYAITYPPPGTGADRLRTVRRALPPNLIDARGVRKGHLKKLLQQGAYDLVSIDISYNDVTYKQQEAALVLANPFHTTEIGSNPAIASIVAPVLQGITITASMATKSVWKPGFVEQTMSSLDLINEKFATALGKPGASITHEQLEAVLHYPSRIPSDNIMLLNGYAGSCKTTSLGIYACLQFMNNPKDASNTTGSSSSSSKGVILAEMHKTADHLVKSLAPFVEPWTKQEVVRDHGLEADYQTLKFILEGCPDDYHKNLSRMTDELHTELSGLFGEMRATMKKHKGQRSSKYNAVEQSVVWRMMAAEGMIQFDNGQPPDDIDRRPAREPKLSIAPPTKAMYSESETEALRATIMQKTGSMPTDKDRVAFLGLLQIIKDQPATGVVDERSKSELMAQLFKVKKAYMDKNVGVIITTISRLRDPSITAFKPTWVACDESQYLNIYNSVIVLTSHPDIPKLFIGDVRQVAPYCNDRDTNSFADTRTKSFFATELERGRPSASLIKSYRTGPSAIGFLSQLCFDGELESAIEDDTRTARLLQMHQKVFGSKSKASPHLIINVSDCSDQQVGYKKSSINPKLMAYNQRYMMEYQKFDSKHKLDDITVIAPYSLQEQAWKKALKALPEGDRPKVETVLGVQGQENILVIVELPRTNSLAFMNQWGFWTEALSRSKIATVILVNDTKIQQSRTNKNGREFLFYDSMIATAKRGGFFVPWPVHLEAASTIEDLLKPSVKQFGVEDTDDSDHVEQPVDDTHFEASEPAQDDGDSESGEEFYDAKTSQHDGHP